MINARLYEKLNFNFIRDIAPVAIISRDKRSVDHSQPQEAAAACGRPCC